MRRSILLCLFIMLCIVSIGESNELSRKEAKEIFLKDSTFQTVFVKTDGMCQSDSGAALIRNSYAVEPSGYHNLDIEPLAKLMPFFGGYVNDNRLIGRSISLLYGDVNDLIIDGIAPIDNYNKIVELTLHIIPNEIGKLLGNATKMRLVVQYQLYDDGWRFSKIDWKKTQSYHSNSIVRLYGFKNREAAMNQVLWGMHEKKLYSDNFLELVKLLENTKNYGWLDTVAWAYKDNGYDNEAITLYRDRIMPAVKKTGDIQQIEDYESSYKKISSGSTKSTTSSATNTQAKKNTVVNSQSSTNKIPSKNISRKEKIDKALQLVADTLENGVTGVEKTVTWDAQPIIGTIITNNFKFRKFPCREFKVVSYESGQPKTMKSQGKACRAEGKWYPYVMFTDASKRSLSSDQLNHELIGGNW